jgi:glycerol kinase
MQFQADILNVNVLRPVILETTALGAAYLAGLSTCFWTYEELEQKRKIERNFIPNINLEKRDLLYKGWKDAVRKTVS